MVMRSPCAGNALDEPLWKIPKALSSPPHKHPPPYLSAQGGKTVTGHLLGYSASKGKFKKERSPLENFDKKWLADNKGKVLFCARARVCAHARSSLSLARSLARSLAQAYALSRSLPRARPSYSAFPPNPNHALTVGFLSSLSHKVYL